MHMLLPEGQIRILITGQMIWTLDIDHESDVAHFSSDMRMNITYHVRISMEIMHLEK